MTLRTTAHCERARHLLWGQREHARKIQHYKTRVGCGEGALRLQQLLHRHCGFSSSPEKLGHYGSASNGSGSEESSGRTFLLPLTVGFSHANFGNGLFLCIKAVWEAEKMNVT